MFDRIFVPLTALLLSACGGGIATTTSVSSPTAIVEDCRKPNMLWDSFSIYAKQVTWKASELTLVFELKNITKSPISVGTGGGTGAVTGPRATTAPVAGVLKLGLVSPQGTTYNPSYSFMGGGPLVSQGAYMDPFVGVSELNPGVPAESRITFQVPKGTYTLRISRTGIGKPVIGPGIIGYGTTEFPEEVYACTVVGN